MHRRGFTKSLAMGVIVLVVMAYGIYFAMQSPIGTPDEKYRIHSPAGFSVIIPSTWLHSVNADPQKGIAGNIHSVPKKASGIQGFFSVTKLTDAPNLEKIISDGYEKSERLPFPSYRKFWDGNYIRHLNYYFEKDGSWFMIELDRNLTEPVDKWWQKYIESLRVESPATPASGTQP